MPQTQLPWMLLVIASLFTHSIALHAEETSSPMVEDTIKILSDRLVYKNKTVKIPITRNNLIKVFGKPSREIYNTAGTMVVWDDLGLTCYGCQDRSGTPEEFEYLSKEERKQIKPIEQVDSITLYVRKYHPYPKLEKKYAHEPRLPFSGKLVLDGVELDGRVTFETFVEKRKSNQTILLPENTFSFFIRCKPSPHEITLHTIRDRYNEDYLSVYAVSIRNASSYYKKIPCIDVFNLQDTPEPVEQIKKQRLEDDSPNNFEVMDKEKNKVKIPKPAEERPVPKATPAPKPAPAIDLPVPVSEPGSG